MTGSLSKGRGYIDAQPELRTQHRCHRLGLDMDAIHLHVAEIALQTVSPLRDRYARAMEQHFNGLAGRAASFTRGTPPPKGVGGTDGLPLLHPCLILLRK